MMIVYAQPVDVKKSLIVCVYGLASMDRDPVAAGVLTSSKDCTDFAAAPL